MRDETREDLFKLPEHKEHLLALDAFIASRAHVGWVAARELDIVQTEQFILSFDPVTRADEIEILKKRGELTVLRTLPTIFKDARVSLKARIDDLELEIQNATNKK